MELQRPDKRHEKEVMALRELLFERNESFDGCGGLEDVSDYDSWLDFSGRLKKKYGADYVPSDLYLAIEGDEVVGIIDYRHPLSPFLLQYGGNIGYSIHPEKRRMGYGSKMLSLLLDIIRENGEKKVLITCDKENIASRKTIINNGGIKENEVADTVNLSKSGIIERYWISL